MSETAETSLPLAVALATWRQTRSSADAERVDALNAAALAAFDAPRARGKDAFHALGSRSLDPIRGPSPRAGSPPSSPPSFRSRSRAASSSSATRASAASMPRPWSGSWRSGTERLTRGWRGLLRVVEEAPYTCADTVYVPAVEALAAAGDPRTIAPLEALLAAPRARTAAVRESLGRLLPDALERLRALGVPPASASPAPVSERAHASAADGEALLARVLAAPDDRAARLVYSDWLQEHGDPRGEFIALQCLEADGRASEKQRKRARALLREHRDAWLGPALAATLRSVKFACGFLVKAELAHNAAATEETWREAASHPTLATVRELLQGRGNARHYRAFVASTAARSLAHFDAP